MSTTAQRMTRDEFIKKYALGPGGTFLADDKGGNSASEVSGQDVGAYYDTFLAPGAKTTYTASTGADNDPTERNIDWGSGNYRDARPDFDGWDNVDPHPKSQRGNGWDETWKTVGRPIATAAATYFGVSAIGGALSGAGAAGAGMSTGAADAALATFDASQAAGAGNVFASAAGAGAEFGATTAPVTGGTVGVTGTALPSTGAMAGTGGVAATGAAAGTTGAATTAGTAGGTAAATGGTTAASLLKTYGKDVLSVAGGLVGSANSRSAASQASDSNAQALAAQKQSTDDQLSFSKQVYADGAEARDFAFQNAKTTAANQQEDRTKYNALQDEQIARGRKYQAVEDQTLSEAQAFDTEGKREELAGKARADVEQGFASAEGSGTRAMARIGVNPNSGRADATRTAIGLSKAGGLAFAGTKARSDAMTLGYARKMDAIGLGKGLVGNQATQAGLQLSAGNSSVQNGGNAVTAQAAGSANMSNAYGSAASGYSNLGKNQQNSFIESQKYGSTVGASTGNAFGQLLNQPGVTNGIAKLWDSWSTPSATANSGGYESLDF